MRIRLDEGACQGHGRCYTLASSVFDSDDLGHCVVLTATPAPGDEEAARSAVDNCPEHALTIVDD
ncbi:MAG TPA: ferredoxin [Acidimicrobiales bacterium]|nr:ferredoxin [Acidimicrobiales bacterium]